MTQKRDCVMQIENQEGVTEQCSWTRLKYFLVKHHACRSCVCRSVPTWLFDVTACPAMCISNRALDSGFLLHSDCNSFSASLSCRELVVVFNFSCQMRKKKKQNQVKQELINQVKRRQSIRVMQIINNSYENRFFILLHNYLSLHYFPYLLASHPFCFLQMYLFL